MQTPQSLAQHIAALEAQAVALTQHGKDEDAALLWAQILESNPVHARALITLGKRACKYGDLATGRRIFDRLTTAEPGNRQAWVNLAVVCRAQKDVPGEERAIERALAAEPYDLVSLILRADFLERQGERHKASAAHGVVASLAPPLEQLPADLRPAVEHALQFREQYQRDYGQFMDEFLESHYRAHGGEKLQRFRDSVDIMLGRKHRYDSESSTYHFPGLLPTTFFDRALFPWLDAVEAATDSIRDEFLNVLKDEEGFTPYLTYPDDVPHNQFAELNNSPRWSAFHLIESGQRNAANAAKCPTTMEVLAEVPQPDQPGRTPSAMFSLLKPKTRIPPHTGVSNVRLVTHLPLIIPEHCGFRVGNDMREWIPGQAWIFDDTINHEAWNNSDKLRVVLIFDTWHPHLTPPERAMVTAMTEGINRFIGKQVGYPL